VERATDLVGSPGSTTDIGVSLWPGRRAASQTNEGRGLFAMSPVLPVVLIDDLRATFERGYPGMKADPLRTKRRWRSPCFVPVSGSH
jgi:hypothetical protein